ncbi:MAG TPA: thiamine pyrophosphate-dependent enzyme [Polyangia bacterium]|nr:thiamine pyrophosphate-dependent enzyme [Polyangia bacterium]
MAAPKTIPPARPPVLAGLNSSEPLVRAGMGAPGVSEIEAWSDEDYARATGLQSILGPAGKVDHGKVDRAALPAFEPAALRDAYRAMLRARALDAAARELVKVGRIGSYAATAGTEAAVVGAVAALSLDDVVAPGRRDAATALARGYPVADLSAQLFGNANDLARGRRLPGCPALPRALNVLPASSHGAAQLPHAAGVAWAANMQKKPTVALALLDAIDVDAEDFHTGLNFAGVFRLPVIFVCVNDGKTAPLLSSETIAVRALAYGIAGVRVDGGDFLAVVAAVRASAERARKGGGATLIEAVLTEGDPLTRLGGWLVAEKILDRPAESAMRREVDVEVRAAIDGQEPVGPPPPHVIIENVLARPTRALAEQLDELDRVRDKTVRP